LAKIVTCCKELCMAIKVGVFYSFLNRSDKTLNDVKQIISYRIKSSSTNLLSRQCCRNYTPQACSCRRYIDPSVLFSIDEKLRRALAQCEDRAVTKKNWLLLCMMSSAH
jgi:hypothetical protein